jgi:transposase
VTSRLREHAGWLVAGGGRLGQVEGRTADDAAYWLAQARPAWRDAMQAVAIDMCSIYAAAVRRMLPGAMLVVDLFHPVQLTVKATGDVRRRAVWDKYGRHGRAGDAEYGIKNLLVRNLEHLSPSQFAKVMDALGRDRRGQQIAAAWIAKDKLRDALNLRARVTGSTPCERNARDRLSAFYDWCAQHDDIPKLVTLASSIARWENEIVAAVLTGVTNARSEALNRIAKLEAATPTDSAPQPGAPRPDRLYPGILVSSQLQATNRDHPEPRPRLASKSRIP